MPLRARENEPPGTPPGFDPGRIPQGWEKAALQQRELEQDHARMRPDEPRTTLGPQIAFVPPVNPPLFVNAPKPEDTRGRLELLAKLTAKLAPLAGDGEGLVETLDRLIQKENHGRTAKKRQG